MKQKLTESRRDPYNSIIVAQDFNTPLSIMNKTTT